MINIFGQSSALKTINIPESVTFIGASAFHICYNLTSEIIIPEGITTIERGTFQQCSSLTAVVIPESVTSISDTSFSYCQNAILMFKSNTPPSIMYDWNFNVDYLWKVKKIYVPLDAVETYKKASVWTHFANIIEGY